MSDKWELSEGSIVPPGASFLSEEQAYNFSLFSAQATAVTLLLYGGDDVENPLHVLPFRLPWNKTTDVWHMRVPAITVSQATYYAYHVSGPSEPGNGLRFDGQKVLLDPYAKGVHFPPGFDRHAACRPGANPGRAPLGLLPRVRETQKSRPAAPRHCHDFIIYELHVRGFTRRSNSCVPVAEQGTFAGVTAKIPYLKQLGITAVELMPVQQFDPQEGSYWGYMPLNFFSAHAGYASEGTAEGAQREFQEMVDALHLAGIEVILDVVYNHTAEGDAEGPTYSFRGIDNSSYYVLHRDDKQRYTNHSGCGNDVQASHPAVRALVVASLNYWHSVMGVDGFRFDLASIFTRDRNGELNTDDPPIMAEITGFLAGSDPRLIAEPWSGDGSGYLLGRSFPGRTWRQWNARFRDDVRRFLRGDPACVGSLMTRLYGSTDLFPDDVYSAARPYQSVNYVNCHDGFNLHDLVSYTRDDQLSWGCGQEGRRASADVAALRRRQARNAICLLMLANGTPMFMAGDEFLHTQNGNSNPYDQDNETTWLDWSLLESEAETARFFRLMIAFRAAHPSIGRSVGWGADLTWYGPDGMPDLSFASHALAYYLSGASQNDIDLYVMINGAPQERAFTVQKMKPWRRVVYTAFSSPEDIVNDNDALPMVDHTISLAPRSIVILIGEANDGGKE